MRKLGSKSVREELACSIVVCYRHRKCNSAFQRVFFLSYLCFFVVVLSFLFLTFIVATALVSRRQPRVLSPTLPILLLTLVLFLFCFSASMMLTVQKRLTT